MANSVRGVVARLYPDSNGCYIKLVDPEDTPKDGYFQLQLKHPNYKCLYALALLVATNRYTLGIRTEQEITIAEHGVVQYMTVNW